MGGRWRRSIDVEAVEIAVVGAERSGKRHARMIPNFSMPRLVAVCDLESETRHNRAGKGKAIPTFPSTMTWRRCSPASRLTWCIWQRPADCT